MQQKKKIKDVGLTTNTKTCGFFEPKHYELIVLDYFTKYAYNA